MACILSLNQDFLLQIINHILKMVTLIPNFLMYFTHQALISLLLTLKHQGDTNINLHLSNLY